MNYLVIDLEMCNVQGRNPEAGGGFFRKCAELGGLWIL